MAKVFRIARLHFPYGGRPRDIVRGAAAGLILFGIGAIATNYRSGFAAYGMEGTAAGATITEEWGRYWGIAVLIGAAGGAALGAGIVFLAGAGFEERGGAAAVIVVGALGGAFLGGGWGSAIATHFTVTVRAQEAADPPMQLPGGMQFKVESGEIRLSGSVERKMNVPLIIALVVAGAIIGALVGRGVLGPWPAGDALAESAEGAFFVKVNETATADPAAKKDFDAEGVSRWE